MVFLTCFNPLNEGYAIAMVIAELYRYIPYIM